MYLVIKTEEQRRKEGRNFFLCEYVCVVILKRLRLKAENRQGEIKKF